MDVDLVERRWASTALWDISYTCAKPSYQWPT